MKIFVPVLSALVALTLAVLGCIFVYAEGGLALTITYAVLCLLFFPVAVLIHELGHIALGAACGFRVKLARTGIFSTSASCEVIPKRAGNMSQRLQFTILGGILFNLLFVVLGGLAYLGGLVILMFSFVLPSSLYLLFVNSFPVRYAGGDTDMLLMAQVNRNTPSAQVLVRVLEVQGLVASGTPLADIEEELLFNVPQIAEDEVAFIMLVALRAEYFAAKGDIAKAAMWKERFEALKEYLPEGYNMKGSVTTNG